VTLNSHPHRRFNPLTGEWVLVSPHRTQRPWQGQVEKESQPAAVAYDPGCYLCPGNPRAGGKRNPLYTSTFIFDNDFPALYPDAPAAELDRERLLVARAERGVCRVVCFSPDHSLTLARMTEPDIRRVVDAWASEYFELGGRDGIAHVQIFENRGEMMGASNPHPHCQIWSTESIPVEPAKELRAQRDYLRGRGRCLLCDYTAAELELGERVVAENHGFAALVPFWAVWPFEILLVSKSHRTGIDELEPPERDALAAILKDVTTRYDALFDAPFPYTMGFHQRPTDSREYPYVHFHAHFYPPLLRSATVRKFMVGFEMLGNPQRDITPEQAAERLRAL
jgi:UDPglucose--hexose-1-phosphate uridylyltransferase